MTSSHCYLHRVRCTQTCVICFGPNWIRGSCVVANLINCINPIDKMGLDQVENVKRIAKYLKLAPGTIFINDEKVNKKLHSILLYFSRHNLDRTFLLQRIELKSKHLLQVISRKVKDKTLSGYTTIISSMAKDSKNDFAQSDILTQCLITQWFDYSVLFIEPALYSKTTDIVLQVRSSTHAESLPRLTYTSRSYRNWINTFRRDLTWLDKTSHWLMSLSSIRWPTWWLLWLQ